LGHWVRNRTGVPWVDSHSRVGIGKGKHVMAFEPVAFTSREASQLSDRLLALYAAQSVGELMTAGVELIRPFIEADTVIVAVCDPRRERVIAVIWPDEKANVACADRLVDLAHESPMFQYWSRTGDHDRVLRRADCCNERAYRSTALYAEYTRPMRQNRHMGTWCRAGGGHHLEMAVARDGRLEFSARDVARFGELRSHLAQAYQNVLSRSRGVRRSRGAAETSSAEPSSARACALQRTNLSASVDAPPARGGSRIELTPRERTVLQWVAAGKTNPEIAIILGTSWRTVRNQLEHVFQKLGVETRTAAAIHAVEMGLVS
jgi:DNA-binding CsgD family transcriptional regulator